MRSAPDDEDVVAVCDEDSNEEESAAAGAALMSLASGSKRDDGRDDTDLASPISTSLPGFGWVDSDIVSAFTGTGGKLSSRSVAFFKKKSGLPAHHLIWT
jgi:hypothetical protein